MEIPQDEGIASQSAVRFLHCHLSGEDLRTRPDKTFCMLGSSITFTRNSAHHRHFRITSSEVIVMVCRSAGAVVAMNAGGAVVQPSPSSEGGMFATTNALAGSLRRRRKGRTGAHVREAEDKANDYMTCQKVIVSVWKGHNDWGHINLKELRFVYCA